ncbi:hypothetical protein HBI56_027450 [Parastagonospora nodorum]|uniref:Uncharacterized protein n=2 Tax=Phaeosphaeria nodorum (strain SN15 / ATCC MYA-4574 / FGSC 10173) TaxID=321614 RepID=A0A7U2I0M7_PHANO|nr:hypothetical protein SNOG_02727 [Parastagonospora nodorum SN15]KAH3919496.1 hypothetical protein HBH56_015100 [Parastagonospora nodorum]EAT89458.1 hypothetical protein SNOG_02727 [Parastagonospora nodorum SN15]KAH3937028.1 hypothetical protein HBH54_019340 [Parastagonospora nodorum]KAH3953847.1 hypothetical protein HBH53_031750 [Parastagonospora nodorum]KAH3969500.1 hypothetical protein HBH51_123910 [Parastagonospora nodorum]
MHLLSIAITFLLTLGVSARPVKDTTISPSGELHFTKDPVEPEFVPEDAALFFLWDSEEKSEKSDTSATTY